MTLPLRDSLILESLHFSLEESRQYRQLLHPFEWVFLTHGDEGYHHHRLLGYPMQMQGDQQLQCQLQTHLLKHQLPDAWHRLEESVQAPIKAQAREWLLLVQIDTDEYAQVTWGEVGSLSYWIKREDLTVRNFAQCWAIDDSL